MRIFHGVKHNSLRRLLFTSELQAPPFNYDGTDENDAQMKSEQQNQRERPDGVPRFPFSISALICASFSSVPS
jgi:hypothetical protein